MPRVSWNTASDFAVWFDRYDRESLGQSSDYRRRADRLEELGLKPTGTIWVVGCGLGFLVEHLIDRGYQAIGVDTSRHIHDRMDEVRDDVKIYRSLEEAPGRPDWIVTELMISSYDDEEVLELAERYDELGGRVVHLMMKAETPPEYNVKTLEEWKALVPHHTWIEV